MLSSLSTSSSNDLIVCVQAELRAAEKFEKRLFLIKFALFLLPVLLFILGIIAIDPFNFFGLPSVVSDAVKSRTSKPLNEVLWKMIDYAHHPSANILLGDSRMNNIDLGYLNHLSRDQYYNLAYGGAAMDEIVDSFWFAKQTVGKLKNVYVGVNLNLWNKFYRQGRAGMFAPMQRNPFLYLLNRTVLKAAGYNLYYQVRAGDPKIGAPSLTRGEFWQWQLHETTNFYYGNFAPSQEYFSEMQKIVKFCSLHKTKLVFVIFPTHVDLQQRIMDLNLQREDERLRASLRALAMTFDFDYPNDFTRAAANFSDPYHYSSAAGHELIDEIWCGKPGFGRISHPSPDSRTALQ
jgi:hypothetical protein